VWEYSCDQVIVCDHCEIELALTIETETRYQLDSLEIAEAENAR